MVPTGVGQMPRLIILLSVSLLLSGCASVSTLPISSVLPTTGSSLDVHDQTLVKLDQANFKVVRTNLVGQCKGFQLLWFISIVPARYTKAMDRLYAKADIRAGKPQTLTHVVLERSSVCLILFSIPQVSVSADLVEFVGERPLKHADRPRKKQ